MTYIFPILPLPSLTFPVFLQAWVAAIDWTKVRHPSAFITFSSPPDSVPPSTGSQLRAQRCRHHRISLRGQPGRACRQESLLVVMRTVCHRYRHHRLPGQGDLGNLVRCALCLMRGSTRWSSLITLPRTDPRSRRQSSSTTSPSMTSRRLSISLGPGLTTSLIFFVMSIC